MAKTQHTAAPNALSASRFRRSFSVEAMALIAFASAVCLFYFWTSHTSPSVTAGTGYYTLLTDAFLDGNTYLPLAPRPELLSLPDPYDPAQNAAYMLTDVSLFDNRYYLYFGPTPVLLVHLPLRVFGVEATDALASAILCSIGFLFSLALARFVIKRYRPSTSFGVKLVAVALLGLANVAPFLLRRPAVWEQAIAAGMCCLLAGLYLTLTGALRERPSLWRLAAGSLALGLAVGARPHLVLAAPLWLWAWSLAWRTRPARRPARNALLAASLVPLAGALLALGVYNAVRFGSPSEFGATYQLGGVNAPKVDRFDVDRLLPGLFAYLLAPPRFDFVFPFAHLDATYTGVLPDSYAAGIEPVAGALATTPILVLALAVPAVIAVRRKGATEAMILASLLVFVSILVMVAPILSFDGATMRYEVDFATLLLLAVLLVWLRVEEVLSARSLARRVYRACAAVMVLASVLIGLALSMTGYWDGLRTANPATYQRVETAFSWIPVIGSMVQGEPVFTGVRQAGTPTAETVLRITAPGAGVVDLRGIFVANPELPPGSVVALDVSGSGGNVRQFPLIVQDTTVRARVGSGMQEISVGWTVRRLAGSTPSTGPPLGGYGVFEPRVVGWMPE